MDEITPRGWLRAVAGTDENLAIRAVATAALDELNRTDKVALSAIAAEARAVRELEAEVERLRAIETAVRDLLPYLERHHLGGRTVAALRLSLGEE